MKRDLYKCTVLGDAAHIEMLYEVFTSPDMEKLIRFDCAECKKCAVGTQVSTGETKVDWKKCNHPLSSKP